MRVITVHAITPRTHKVAWEGNRTIFPCYVNLRTILTLVPIPSRSTCTASSHTITRGLVLTPAVELTVDTIEIWRAACGR
jgi:hypothetical protein